MTRIIAQMLDLVAAGDELVNPASPALLAAATDALVEACHGAAVAAGWYTDLKTGEPKKMNDGERAMLQISEIAEAMEGYRKNLQDDKLPHRPMIEVELADTVIRVADHAGYLKLPLGRCIANCHSNGWAPCPVVDQSNVPERLLQIAKTLCDADTAGDTETWQCRRRLPFRGLHLAKALLLIGALCKDLKLDLGGALAEKMAFNQVRPDHKKEARLAEGGKFF